MSQWSSTSPERSPSLGSRKSVTATSCREAALRQRSTTRCRTTVNSQARACASPRVVSAGSRQARSSASWTTSSAACASRVSRSANRHSSGACRSCRACKAASRSVCSTRRSLAAGAPTRRSSPFGAIAVKDDTADIQVHRGTATTTARTTALAAGSALSPRLLPEGQNSRASKGQAPATRRTGSCSYAVYSVSASPTRSAAVGAGRVARDFIVYVGRGTGTGSQVSGMSSSSTSGLARGPTRPSRRRPPPRPACARRSQPPGRRTARTAPPPPPSTGAVSGTRSRGRVSGTAASRVEPTSWVWRGRRAGARGCRRTSGPAGPLLGDGGGTHPGRRRCRSRPRGRARSPAAADRRATRGTATRTVDSAPSMIMARVRRAAARSSTAVSRALVTAVSRARRPGEAGTSADAARFTRIWARAGRAGLTAYERGCGVERSAAGSGLRRSRTRIDSENWSTDRAVARCSRRRTQYCTK